MRRAKIVCTLGPATTGRLRELVDAGMDVARFNLSHGSYEDHERTYHELRRASDDSGRAVAVLVDLQGPKIRLGTFEDGRPVQLLDGDTFRITTRDVVGNSSICSTTYKGLCGDVGAGDVILVDDGKVMLRATEVTDDTVVTRVEVAGRGLQQQGPEPARGRGERARDVREGRAGPALGAAPARGHDRAVLRPQRQGRRGRAPGDGRGGPAAAGDRQDGEAAGGRAHGRHRAGLRRHHGRPRGPRRGAAAGRGPDGAEAPGGGRAAPGQAGDRGDPGAGLDDRAAPADQGGGVGLLERRAGRC